jgi:hypothetical protein
MLVSALVFSACTTAAPAMNDNQNEAMVENTNANDDSAYELEGVIESLDGDTWVVAGKTVFVNASVLGSAVFAAGDSVKVKGALNDDGTVTALEVELLASANVNSNDANSNADNSNSANSNDANSNSSSSNANSNTSSSNSNDDDDD